MATSTWTSVLENFTAETLLNDSFELKQAETTTTVPEALELLTKHRLQCLPVWDNAAGMYVGLVDMLDILALVTVASDCKGIVDVASHDSATWEAFWAQENEVIRTFPIAELCNISERNPWVPVDIATPLVDVLSMFGRGSGLKRVPVIDGEGFMRGFITQSAIIAWLSTSLALLNSDILSKKMHECEQLGSTDVRTVSTDGIALDAFRNMIQDKLSALAVVSPAGALVGCISGSDLKGSEGVGLFSDLSKPVAEYLAASSERFQRPDSLHPVTVSPDSSVGDLLTQIHAHRVHRVFLVDPATSAPLKLISLTDIITFLQNQH